MVEVVAAAPGHVANVRDHVIDALTPSEVRQLRVLADALLARLDPEGRMSSLHDRKSDVRLRNHRHNRNSPLVLGGCGEPMTGLSEISMQVAQRPTADLRVSRWGYRGPSSRR